MIFIMYIDLNIPTKCGEVLILSQNLKNISTG